MRFRILVLLIIVLVLAVVLPYRSQALTYFELVYGQTGKVLGIDTSMQSNTSCPLPAENAFTACFFNDAGGSKLTNFVFGDITNKITYNWGLSSPNTKVNTNNFSAQWQGYFDFIPGEYEFTVSGDDGLRLYIDGEKILDKWIDQPNTSYKVNKKLTTGKHLVNLEYYENGGYANVVLDWVNKVPESINFTDTSISPSPKDDGASKTAVTAMCGVPGENIFNTCYYNGTYNTNFGASSYFETNNEINFDWGLNSPNTLVNKDKFSVTWLGNFNFDEGDYNFVVTGDDGVKLIVDNEIVIDKWLDQSATTYTKLKKLSAGKHLIELKYYENTGYATAKLTWQKINSTISNTPTAVIPPVVNKELLPVTIDTLKYFTGVNNSRALTGTHPMNLTVTGQTAYYVKWASDSFEIYNWDDEYIYLKEDHSGSPVPGSYTYSDGRWLKRQMKVGESIIVNDNKIQYYIGENCTANSSGNFPYKITLEGVYPSMDLGGDLGLQDVMVIKYDYTNGSGTDFEKSYYSSQWGWVKWELYRNNKVIQTSVFNKNSTQSVLVPNLKVSCLNKPVVSTLPTIPTSISGLVSHMYGCVLKNNTPDQAGVNYWVGNLKDKVLTVPQFYKEIYKSQTWLSNEEFVTNMYNCILFKVPDNGGYNYWLNVLNARLDSRENQVGYFIKSQVFQNEILPKLDALK